jgi:hypothetical protein
LGAVTHHDHLAEADRLTAECKNCIARQREIIARAYENGHPTVFLCRCYECSSKMRSFEKHRQLVLDQQKKADRK